MPLNKIPPEMLDVSADFAHFQDQKSSGTDAGSASAATTVTRTLNATVVNNITGCSLGSNQVTLPAGTYYIEANVPAYRTDRHRAKLYNVTDAANALLGTTEVSGNGGTYATSRSFIAGRVTITGTKAFDLRHYTQTARATDGQGFAGATGDTEVFTEIRIWKIA